MDHVNTEHKFTFSLADCNAKMLIIILSKDKCYFPMKWCLCSTHSHSSNDDNADMVGSKYGLLYRTLSYTFRLMQHKSDGPTSLCLLQSQVDGHWNWHAGVSREALWWRPKHYQLCHQEAYCVRTHCFSALTISLSSFSLFCLHFKTLSCCPTIKRSDQWKNVHFYYLYLLKWTYPIIS